MKKLFSTVIFIFLINIQNSNSQVINYGKFNLYASYSFDTDGTDSLGNNAILFHNAKIVDDAVRGKVASISISDASYMEFIKLPVVADNFTFSFFYLWKNTNRDAGKIPTPWQVAI